MNYNEEPRERHGSLIINLLLKILLIIAFIFVLVWLFPTKNYLNPLFQEIFRNNINSMKDSATTYFTNERLPKNVGDKVRLTLREMLDMKLLLPFVDKYDKECNLDTSYVEITKTETEYELKVYLSCSKEEAYIIEHLGCTDKCNTGCNGNKDNTTPSNPSNPSKTTITEYEFQRLVEKEEFNGYECKRGYTIEGKTCIKKITKTDTKDATPNYEVKETLVDATKNEEKITKYRYKYGKTITDYEYVEDTTKPIRHYTYNNIIGYQTKKVCTGFNYFIDNTSSNLYTGSDWVYQGTKSVTEIPSDSINTKYEVIGMDYDVCMSSCTLKPYYLVKVYTRSVKQETRSEQELIASCTVAEKQIPIYGLKITFEGFVKNKVPVTKEVYKWSSSSNDKTLINDGYKYLNIKEVESTETKITYTCPINTTKTSDPTKCSKKETVLKGYTCPSGYTLSNKKCTKTYTETDKYDAKATYRKVSVLEYTWSTSKTLKGWTATGRTRTVTR